MPKECLMILIGEKRAEPVLPGSDREWLPCPVIKEVSAFQQSATLVPPEYLQ